MLSTYYNTRNKSTTKLHSVMFSMTIAKYSREFGICNALFKRLVWRHGLLLFKLQGYDFPDRTNFLALEYRKWTKILPANDALVFFLVGCVIFPAVKPRKAPT